MAEQGQINKVKETVEEFFSKMTILISDIETSTSSFEKEFQDDHEPSPENKEAINVSLKLEDPQILIGQGGQTLFEIQRILRMILNKRLQKVFYFNLDINDYKNKKIEYLKDLSKTLADQVFLTREEKILLPMPSYERRIIHAELAKRLDISTESQGEGLSRHIVIKPK